MFAPHRSLMPNGLDTVMSQQQAQLLCKESKQPLKNTTESNFVEVSGIGALLKNGILNVCLYEV